jgi:hypothetical protein
MKAVLGGIALTALVAAPLPVCAMAPSTAGASQRITTLGNSAPGIPGLPGTESGPTVTPKRQVMAKHVVLSTRLQDVSGLRGRRDTQSGAAAKPA